MVNNPTKYDFIPHYRGDTLPSIHLKFTANGDLVDFTLCSALMQLRAPSFNKRGVIAWEFDSSSTDLEKKLILTSDGLVIIPTIKEWQIPANTYDYDLQITDKNGFVKTFINGVWAVNQDVSIKTI